MHGPAGHTTHFNDAIAASIRDKMKDCIWKQRVDEVVPAITVMKNKLSEEVEDDAAFHESKEMRKQLTTIQSQITRYINQAAKIEDDDDLTIENLV